MGQIQAAATHQRILLVEDNAVDQLVACRMLSRMGYTWALAADGVQAIDWIGRERFDLILMDCKLPELDGYETTRRIRQVPGWPGQVPIIAMTAQALVGDRERCLAAGMSGYLSKPVQYRALRTTLATVLADASSP